MKKSIFEIVKRRSLPIMAAYHKDLLVHDRRSIEQFPGVPFVHFTGTTGTTIIFFSDITCYPKKYEKVRYIFGISDRVHILKDSTIALTEALPKSNRTILIQHFDGHKVHKITMEQAAYVVRAYYIDMMKQFKKDLASNLPKKKAKKVMTELPNDLALIEFVLKKDGYTVTHGVYNAIDRLFQDPGDRISYKVDEVASYKYI